MANYAFLFVTLMFAYTGAENATPELDVARDWQCGYTSVERAMAFNLLKVQCPSGMFEVNYCCETHDICYNEQFGKATCDNTFCQCLNDKAKEHCPKNVTFNEMFCGMVRAFGDVPYRESGNNNKKSINIALDMTFIVDGNLTGLSNKTGHKSLNEHKKIKREVDDEDDPVY